MQLYARNGDEKINVNPIKMQLDAKGGDKINPENNKK